MDEIKRKVQLESVSRLMEMGVTGIKVELEATLNRMGDSDNYCDDCDGEGSYTCRHCDGDGNTTCNVCDGEGEIANPIWTATASSDVPEYLDCTEGSCEGGYVNCDHCEDGNITCDNCDGQSSMGNDTSYESERDCLEFLLTKLGVPSSDIAGGMCCHDDLEGYEIHNPLPWLRYINFYNDHSVDSETTFTVRLTTPEDAFRVMDVINAFQALSDEIGNGMVVTGAGMHMSVVFDKDCDYPSSHALHPVALANFRDSMRTLMPALFFLSSTNKNTRSMSYRMPNVSIGSVNDNGGGEFGRNSKYSAIHYTGGALEFRVFDTCYDKPEAVMDNIVVMKNCLEYMTLAPRKKIKSVIKGVERFTFGNDQGRDLERLYVSVDHLRLLNAGLLRIKPSYYTIRDLKKQRGFKVSLKDATTREERAMADAIAKYREYDERFELSIKYKEIQVKNSMMREYIERMPADQLGLLNEEELEKTVQQSLKQYMDDERGRKRTKSAFIKEHIRNVMRLANSGTTIYVPNN